MSAALIYRFRCACEHTFEQAEPLGYCGSCGARDLTPESSRPDTQQEFTMPAPKPLTAEELLLAEVARALCYPARFRYTYEGNDRLDSYSLCSRIEKHLAASGINVQVRPLRRVPRHDNDGVIP